MWEPEGSEGIGLTLMKSPLKFQKEIVVVINIIIEFLAQNLLTNILQSYPTYISCIRKLFLCR